MLLQWPGTTGVLADLRPVVERARAAGAVVTVAVDLLSLTLLSPPGEWGADIAIGSAQRFGVPMGYGGPHAAYLACRDDFRRSLPGRLVGRSVDAGGAPALRYDFLPGLLSGFLVQANYTFTDAKGLISDGAIDAPTDVLSFAEEAAGFVLPPGMPRPLGELVVSYERVLAQAAEYGHSPDRELAFLVVHGTLHLLGYDHERGAADDAAMRERQRVIMGQLGLGRGGGAGDDDLA